MVDHRTTEPEPEPEPVEDVEENDEVQRENRTSTSSNTGRNSDENHIREERGSSSGSGYFSRMMQKKIGGDDLEKWIELIDKEEESLESRMVIRERTAEQVNRSMIFLSLNFEFVAGIYAFLRIRSRNLSWRARAIRILPMFLVPALASFFYSLFSRFISMLNLRDRRLLERLRKDREAKMQESKERANNYMAKRHIQEKYGLSIEEMTSNEETTNAAPEIESSDSTIITFTGVDQLPEEINWHMISRTTPHDACVFSAVPHAFRSVANSDATWDLFLPSDYASLLSQAADPVEYTSKKELYFQLCDHPILIDGGLMSFGLEKSSGAKIFMVSARRLSIAQGNDTRYWEWIARPDSRFSECAELKLVFWLDISGEINGEILTPNTLYAAYLVFKLRANEQSLRNPFQTTGVSIAGDIVSQHSVCLNPGGNGFNNVVLPGGREDGWLEVELGAFHSGAGIDGEVLMFFRERSDDDPKSGLIVQGFEVRPH